ncbi:family 78 glycoside hydrolase catalytic domain [Streptomyces sp. NPDC020917]|uniref:family 78 glycoside hydrolase catalytic domain n=1 Tax=Streptomyces sp. NPDC020917 TaxID=3365102 RepID=UPI00378F52A1
MSSGHHTTVARPRGMSVLLTTAILTTLSLTGSGMAAAAPGNHAPLAPGHLTVDDQSRPLEVEGAPQFGWQPRDPDSGESQSAYEIVVTRAATASAAAQQVWDSGKVTSADEAYVPYGGPALADGTSYTWTVRTWDRAGAASKWAAPASFDTGITDAEWKASWIRRTTGEKDDYTLARKEFTTGASQVVRARLYLSAYQQYQAYINGKLVDRGPAYAYTDEGYYQATDVTQDVKAGGANAIGVLYHWYGPGQGRPSDESGMLARLVVDHADGSQEVVLSDGTWQVTRGPWLTQSYRNSDGRDYRESVDGRLAQAQEGWTSPGFDDSSWQAPQVVGVHPSGVFTHLQAQQIRLDYQTVHPVKVTTLADGSAVADFGRIIPAMPRLTFAQGVSGRTVSLNAGYLLAADGSVSTSNHDNQSTNLSYSYTEHDGAQTFQAYTYEGFRYLQISGAGEPLDASSIAAVVQHVAEDPDRAATFTSSDPTLNQVDDLLQRSALYDTQEQFLDTPTREKGQFLGDSVDISRALMAGSGDRNQTAKAIKEFAESQKRYWPDGRLNAVYPNGDGKRDIPDYTEMYPGWVWDYYLNSGDRSLVADTYQVSLNVADYVRRYIDPATGLVTKLAGGSGSYANGIIDWPNRYGYDTATTARTTVNILAVDVLRSTAKQAEVIGRPQAEIDALRADADKLSAAITSKLRRADGIYTDGLEADGSQSAHASQIANAYALAFGIAPDDTVGDIAEYIAQLKLQMSPMTANWLLTALHAAGRDDQVLARLTDATSLGWANILAQGGTFTWESWEAPQTGDSLSHGWGATALVDLQQAMLGVTLTSPGGRTLSIAPPRDTALTHAAGTVWTQSGTVAVHWTTGGHGTTVTVDIPDNTTATVAVPVTGEKAPHAVGAGPDGADGPRLEGIHDGVAVYTVGSGHSAFTPGQ